MSFIYLASPYSDPDIAVRQHRYEVALQAMAQISTWRIAVYCPIAVWHPVSLAYDLPGDAEHWRAQDEPFLCNCIEGWVLMMPGWKESVGVRYEVEFLRQRHKPVYHLQPQYIETFLRATA